MTYTIRDNEGNIVCSVENTTTLSYESINNEIDKLNKYSDSINKSIEAFNFISDTRAMEALGYITDGREYNSDKVEYTIKESPNKKPSKLRKIFDKIIEKIKYVLNAIKKIIETIAGKIKDAVKWISNKIKVIQIVKVSLLILETLKISEVSKYFNGDITEDELIINLKNQKFSKVFSAMKDIFMGDNTKTFFMSYNIYTNDSSMCDSALSDIIHAGTDIDKYGKMMLKNNNFPFELEKFDPNEMIYSRNIKKFMDKMDKANADKMLIANKLRLFTKATSEFSSQQGVNAYFSKLNKFNESFLFMKDRASAIIDYSEETKDNREFSQEELHFINAYQGCVIAFCKVINYFSKFTISLLQGTSVFIRLANAVFS